MKFKIINVEYLNEISSNPDFIKKMLLIFRDNVLEYEKEMNEALKNEDFVKLAGISHKAKSSVMILGMKNEADILKNLELDAKRNLKVETFQQRVNEFVETCKKALLEIDILEKEL